MFRRLAQALALLVPLLVTGEATAQQKTMVPVSIDGQSLRLENRGGRPEAPGRVT